jgi:hypothetical protein
MIDAHADEGAQNGLKEPDPEKIHADPRVEEPQKIRIEGRHEKGFLPHPISGGQRFCPEIIVLGIDDVKVLLNHGAVGALKEVEDAEHEAREVDGQNPRKGVVITLKGFHAFTLPRGRRGPIHSNFWYRINLNPS